MLSVAVVGGGIRDKLLAPRLGVLLASKVETVALAALFAAGITAYVRMVALTPLEAVVVGMAWFLATVVFETFLGRVILKESWQEVLANYDLPAGRLWPVVLIVILITPYLAAQWPPN
jgi:hypothetical protein